MKNPHSPTAKMYWPILRCPSMRAEDVTTEWLRKKPSNHAVSGLAERNPSSGSKCTLA